MARAIIRDDLVENLEAQVDALRKEISSLRRSMSRQGSRAYGEVSETAGAIYEDLAERWMDALPHIRKGARDVERRARDNPGKTAAAAIVVVGLIGLLLSKR